MMCWIYEKKITVKLYMYLIWIYIVFNSIYFSAYIQVESKDFQLSANIIFKLIIAKLFSWFWL